MTDRRTEWRRDGGVNNILIVFFFFFFFFLAFFFSFFKRRDKHRNNPIWLTSRKYMIPYKIPPYIIV